MFDAHYQGCVCLEYVCVDWRRCNECDVMTETLLLRDALRVALDGTGRSDHQRRLREGMT
jgi:hypothetical protein